MQKNDYFCEYYETSTNNYLSLMVDITNNCNLQCSYCYYGQKHHQTLDMPKALQSVKAIFDALSDRVTKLNIHYMGGEPLLEFEKIKQFNRLVQDSISDIEFSWSLTSNIVGLTDDIMEYMIDNEAAIHASCDGPADIQNKNRPFRNGCGSSKIVHRNLHRAVRITPNDTLRTTIRPEDSNRVQEVCDLAYSVGYKKVSIMPAAGPEIQWSYSNIEGWYYGIRSAVKWMRDNNISDSFLRTVIKQVKSNQNPWCGGGKNLWAIAIDGSIAPCHRFTNDDTFTKIPPPKDGKEFIRKAMEISVTPNPVKHPDSCNECECIVVCGGGCWANNLLCSGNAMIPNEIDCAIKKATYRAFEDESFFIELPGDNNSDITAYTRGCGPYATDQIIEYKRKKATCTSCYSCEGCLGCDSSCDRHECSEYCDCCDGGVST